jgi:hypothetical protein
VFRRRRFLAGKPGTPTQPQLKTLATAQQLLSENKPVEAAALFAQLAQRAEKNGRLKRAANLHAQAAHAYAAGSQEQAALAQGRRALNLFIQLGMNERSAIFLANLRRKLRAHGLQVAADALDGEFGEKVPALGGQASQAVNSQHGSLPSNCPQCGGPLRSDEVDWIDAHSAECPFCGSVITTV